MGIGGAKNDFETKIWNDVLIKKGPSGPYNFELVYPSGRATLHHPLLRLTHRLRQITEVEIVAEVENNLLMTTIVVTNGVLRCVVELDCTLQLLKHLIAA